MTDVGAEVEGGERKREKGVDVARRKQHQSYINQESEQMEGQEKDGEKSDGGEMTAGGGREAGSEN